MVVTSVAVYTASRMSNIRREAKCERALVHIVYLHHMATCYRILNFYGGGGHVKVVSQSVSRVCQAVCLLTTDYDTDLLSDCLAVSFTNSLSGLYRWSGTQRNPSHRIRVVSAL